MESLTKGSVEAAVRKRGSYIRENSETLSLKQARRLVEKDLNLPLKALDDPRWKPTVATAVDAVLAEPASQENSTKQIKSRESVGSCNKRHITKAKKEKDIISSKTGPKTGLGLSREAVKLKGLLTQCTIKITPNLYKGADEDEFVRRLEELLAKHGLSRHSSHSELQACRRLVAKERELDGIDTSNVILTQSRRARPQVNYAQFDQVKADSDQDSEEDKNDTSDESDKSNESDDNVSDPPRRNRKFPGGGL